MAKDRILRGWVDKDGKQQFGTGLGPVVETQAAKVKALERKLTDEMNDIHSDLKGLNVQKAVVVDQIVDHIIKENGAGVAGFNALGAHLADKFVAESPALAGLATSNAMANHLTLADRGHLRTREQFGEYVADRFIDERGRALESGHVVGSKPATAMQLTLAAGKIGASIAAARGQFLPPGIFDLSDPAIAAQVVNTQTPKCARSLAEVRDQAAKAFERGGDPGSFAEKWFSLGFPTFELTGGLATALCMTETRGLKGADYQMPFGAIAIQMPRPSPLLFNGKDVMFLLVDRRESLLLYWDDPSIDFPCAACNLPMPPADEERIDDWTKPIVERIDVMQFVVNVCVYITSLHALPAPDSPPKKSSGGGSKGKGKTTPTRWILGREIKLSKGMVQAVRVGQTKGLSAATHRLHARFMVRGHWRNQAHGKGRLERKKKWITAHWKGPELAEGLARLYSAE